MTSRLINSAVRNRGLEADKRLVHTTAAVLESGVNSLLESACQFRQGQPGSSPAAVLSACEAQMQEQAATNAITHPTLDTARVQAENSARRWADGHLLSPIDGVPVALKDNFCEDGVPTTACSNMLRGFTPPYDATVVERLKRAGAVIVGKTNMDEFGMGSATIYSARGPCLSPWRSAEGDTSAARVAGGSSGGSAAAVAAGMAAAALGSDTGGSVRQPAGYTGTVGLKPSYGRLSRHGLIAFASSLDCPGIFVRSVPDAAVLLAVLQGQDPRDPTSIDADPSLSAVLAASPEGPAAVRRALAGLLPRRNGAAAAEPGEGGDRPLAGVRVGIPMEYNVAEMSLAAREAWRRGVEWMQRAGASIHSVSLPHTRHALGTYYIIAPAEASSNLARYDGIRYGTRAPPPATKPNSEGTGRGSQGAGPDSDRMKGDSEAAGWDSEGMSRASEAAGPRSGAKTGVRTAPGRRQRDAITAARTAGFGREVQRRVLLGTFVLSSRRAQGYFLKASRVRSLIAADFAAVFEDVDVLLTPTAPGVAPSLAEARAMEPAQMYASDVMTLPASLAGLPAISIPAGVSALEQLPVGLQLIGRPRGDVALLAVAAALEERAKQDTRKGPLLHPMP